MNVMHSTRQTTVDSQVVQRTQLAALLDTVAGRCELLLVLDKTAQGELSAEEHMVVRRLDFVKRHIAVGHIVVGDMMDMAGIAEEQAVGD